MLPLADWLLFFFLWRQLFSAAVEGFSLSLPAPQNLTIRSYNFQNVLSWSPVKGISGPVFYSVQRCLQSDQRWEKVNCTDITEPECDFDHIKDFYRIILRVRAEQGKLKSEWTEAPVFIAKRHTILGPPRAINVTSEANSILLSFLPPFDQRSNFSSFEYTIYWENSTDKSLVIMNTIHRLKNLKERTMYCFRIQATLSELKGEKSGIYCAKTTITEGTRILFGTLILGFVVLVLVLIFVLLITIRKYSSIIKSFWQPPLTIPSHYEEDLNDPQMITIEEFQNCAGEDHVDIISIISRAEEDKILTSFASEHS
ncbi:interferon gamma receptor 2 [Candoia aspera]|uniref:interferon gamma receptor 2 n=1 Tax=Candoia aspera TaxID=51853 RepID=UPI002FD7FFA2